MIRRLWLCPRCRKRYYIQPKSRDERDIIACVQIAGFALRQCMRCGWVMTIKGEQPESESQERTGKNKMNGGTEK